MAGELDPLAQCRQTNCSDVAPDALKTCVITSCGKQFSALSESCRGCLLANDGKPSAEVAAACSPEEKFPCVDGELTPLSQCRVASCSDVPPEMLKTCVISNCGKQFSELSETCRGCLLTNDGKPPQEVAAICLPPVPAAPTAHCETTELDTFTSCAATLCADAAADEVQECSLQQCFLSYVALSGSCMACLGPDQDIATAKTRCVTEVAP